MSRFPLGFKGCYNCGGTDHFSTREFPPAMNGKFNKSEFFKEMWLHKPHTKISNYDKNRATSRNSENPNFSRSSILNTHGNHDKHNSTFNSNYTHPRHQNQHQHQNQNANRNPNPNQNQSCTQNQHQNQNQHHHQNQNQNHHHHQNNSSQHYSPQPDHPSSSNYSGVDNRPAWQMNTSKPASKDEPLKKQRLFVLSGTILNTTTTSDLRPMPLSLDNSLPAAIFRFGTSAENEIPFPCHLDSCAAMNTGNLTLHQWIMTTYPEIVHSYEQFDDAKPFAPISLACAVPSSESDMTSNKLTSVVTYKTRYQNSEGENIYLSFGLGLGIKLNAIVGPPTFRECKLILDLDANRVISKSFGLYFDLCFENAATGLPAGITFDTTKFLRPPRPNHTGLNLLTQCAESLAKKEEINQKDKTMVIHLDQGADSVIKSSE